jgi:hypothetical protein
MPFLQNREQKVKQVLPGVGNSERGEDIRKGCKRVNVVEILYTHG